MALAFATVTNSIAALSVSGVTIKDIDECIAEVLERDCPLIQPGPIFITNLSVERDSQGPGSSALKTATYTFNYRMFFAPAGAGRGYFDLFDGMIAKAGLFLDAIITDDALTGTVDISPVGVLDFGIVTDPSEVAFHGCDFQLQVQEFVN